jgi:hypothetical protein
VSDAGTLCVVNDTQAEADKARKEYRRMFSGFNLRFVDLAWRPSGQGSAMPAAAPVMAAAAVAPAAAPPVVAPAMPATVRKYCHAYMLRTASAGGVRTRVWEDAGSDGGVAAMGNSLASFVSHMREAQPGVWGEFPPVKCNEGAGYCFAVVPKQRGQEAQVAGQFCDVSREAAEAGWQRLANNDAAMTLVAWPPAAPGAAPPADP